MINYEQDIRIDPDSLDVEWLEQPSLAMKYNRNAAEAKRSLDLAKEKLDITRAELDKEIRTNPKKFGLEKTTDAIVVNMIPAQESYKEANAEFIKAKYDADIALSAVYAINQRKEALENLVKLHGMNYFAGPKVPRDLSYETRRREEQKNIDSGIARKMMRRLNN